MPRTTRSLLLVALTALAGSLALPASAAPFAHSAVLAAPKAKPKAKAKPPLQGKKAIAVGTIAGKRAGKVRQLIFERLKDSNAYEVADTEDLKPGDKKATIAKNAKALKVNGVLLGRVSDKHVLTLNVYGADGKLVKEVEFKGGTPEKLENAVRNEFDLLAGPAIAQATGGKNLAESKPPPTEVVEEEEEEPGTAEEEPKEEEPKEEEEEPEQPKEEDEDESGDGGKSEPSKPGRDPFELVGGVRGYNRKFAYQAPVTDLLPYSLGFGPALLLGGRVYPAAFFRDDFAANVGIVAHGELGIATSTDYTTNVPGGGQIIQELETVSQEWNLGLIVRLPLDPVELSLSGVYGMHTFILRGDEFGEGLPPLVPDVKYQYLRPSLEGRGRVSKFLLGAHVAPRFLLSIEQIDLEGIWFPGATGFGFEFGVMGGYAVLPFLDVVVGFDYLRYGFDFSGIPKDAPTCASTFDPPGCQKVAEGASDTYISGWLGAMVRFGGSEPKK
jgi:hypothetical protein